MIKQVNYNIAIKITTNIINDAATKKESIATMIKRDDIVRPL